MPTYRDLARSKLNTLMEMRKSLPVKHPVYRSSQLVSHLSYRGPHQDVRWLGGTTPAVIRRAEELEIVEGMKLPVAMGIALDAIRNELQRTRGDLGDELADRFQDLVTDLKSAMETGDDPANDHELHLEWPTIEWVKIPADLKTGLPNGAPIAMRHFADCKHWFEAGDPPFLASDNQMASLPACGDCIYKAKLSGNDQFGPRLGSREAPQSAEPPAPMPVLLDLDETDATATVRVRREQRHLREHLLGGSNEFPCDLCGRLLPSSLLVAAHIVPRRELNDAQRLDFTSTAMLACTLGCDTLFELGYLVICPEGTVQAGKRTTGAVADAVAELQGRHCSSFNENTSGSFARHAEMHEGNG